MSSSHIRHVVDSNILIYALLRNHPAHADCARYLAFHDFEHTLFSTTDSLNELYHAFVFYYQLDPKDTMNNISNIMESNIVFMPPSVNKEEIYNLAMEKGLQLNDVELYFLALETQSPVFVTDDAKLTTFIKKHGLVCETPIQLSTREEMAKWESLNMPKKGLPRILANVHVYLSKIDQETAKRFKDDTKGFLKLPVREESE